MKKSLIILILCLMSAAASAQQVTPQPTPPPTPSVTFTGPELDELFTRLNSPTMYQRDEKGDFVRMIDPNVRYVMQAIVGRVNEARRKITEDEKKAKDAADAKTKADADAKAEAEKKAKDAVPEPVKP